MVTTNIKNKDLIFLKIINIILLVIFINCGSQSQTADVKILHELVVKGDTKKIIQLIETNPHLINYVHNNRFNLLHYSVMGN